MFFTQPIVMSVNVRKVSDPKGRWFFHHVYNGGSQVKKGRSGRQTESKEFVTGGSKVKSISTNQVRYSVIEREKKRRGDRH